MRKLLFCLSIICHLSFSVAQTAQVSIAPYYGGRQAALSLTFDDGLQDQYTLAWPELKKRGLKATFAVVGSKVGGTMHSKQDRIDGTDGTPTMTWDMLRELVADGQEISSHGWEHRSVSRLDSIALCQEVERNDSAIMAETGFRPVTYVYPGNNKSPETIAFCEQGRVGSRTFQVSVGSKRTLQFLCDYVDSLIVKGQWGVTMTHGIAQGYDHFSDPQVMWDFLDYIQSKSSELWVATFRDVTAYIRERDDAHLSVTPTESGFSVSIATSLPPQLFSHPLTLVVPAHVTSATQDGHPLTITYRNGNTLVDVNPHGGALSFVTIPVSVSTAQSPVLSSQRGGELVTLSRLTVEGRVAPMGIDVEAPRLGWVIESDKQNVVQTAYQVQIALTPSFDELLWDSGEQHLDQSQWVQLSPKTMVSTNRPQHPNTRYYWRVRVKTNKGETDWYQSHWTTGLLSEKNWKGDWIGYDSLTADVVMEHHSRIAARYLRKEFSLSDSAPIRRAMVHICGLGYYILNINGQRIGDYLLAPAPTQYDRAVCYDTYDVTSEIVNCNLSNCKLEVVLGGGYFYPPTQNYQTNVRSAFGMPKLRLNLIVEYDDGTSETIATDSTWQVAVDGPIRYANLYDGTLIDYRMTPKEWMPVQLVDAPAKVMRGGLLPGVKAYATENIVGMTKTGDKRYILDFGTNNTGRIYLPEVRITDGDTVRVRYAETLKADGRELYTANLREAQNTDLFVGNGQRVTLTTEFLWHGFRYMEVTGLDEADVRRITRQLMTDDLISDATIEIDEGDRMINRILANARRGILSNYKGIPMDCPQRDERMPWLGDRTMGCFGESYLTRNHALYAKWLQDICDAQRPDGCISDVSPAYWRLYNGNITWPAALPFGMEMMRLQYGDERPMEEHSDNVRRFLAYAKKKSGKDGLITYDRYGDWCVPPATLDEVVTKDSTRMTDGTLLSLCYYYYICKMMGMEDEAKATSEAINRTFLKDGNYANGTVTANLLPLALGIVPEDQKEAVQANFMRKVKGSSGEPHIDCGVIGISWLMRYLSKAGLGDVAYQIASTKTYPGWGYMVENGATTIWELWNGNTANPSMNSGNHVMMLGDLIPWAFECVAGIAPDPERPGFKHIIMRPDFSNDSIRGAKATFPSVYGNISSEWTRKSGYIAWNVTIPANTTATLYMPDGMTKEIGSGSYTFNITTPVELPTMGWSSWNTYRVNISDSLIMRQADAMVAQGLKDAGYTYINIDDGYFGGRDIQTGCLKTHPERFPQGLKPVVDHIHALGLKAGIYSDAGANTCGNWYDKDSIAEGVGFFGHDQQDCDLFFRELGFDFIKIDFCGGSALRNSGHLALSPQERYTAIHQAILNTGRKDVRMNVCRWDYPGTWVSDVASSWRMSRDISPRWSVVKEIIHQNLYLSAYAGGGHYNDMDMLEVGRSLTNEEDRTHFGLWCMMASPLLIGCDMTKLKPQTLALLTNRDLIAIDQDPLGLQAYVVQHDMQTGTYVLVKDLLEYHGSTRAVAFYNPTDITQAVSIDMKGLELGGVVQAKDLYDNGIKPLTLQSSSFTQEVPPHGCRIFCLTAERRLLRTHYEAETAYLSCYQELSNPLAVGTAYYATDTLCSGGMKVTNLGHRPENDLQWRDIWCDADGQYRITIHCPSFTSKTSLLVAANGENGHFFKPEDVTNGIVTLYLRLRKGQNTIRLYNDNGPMPEIDYMTIDIIN